MSKPESPNTPSINQKLADLNTKIEWFYSDDFSLDSASKNYKTAVALAKEIENDLENLKNDIKILGHDFTR
ncbi:exodeoxyribonuclease VII small subunit [Candidatus Saccharibacteria bacterium]|nr:exodeoxyribonuclease VII small subunit [Candidatus Saccharibacteria bacterium]